MSGEKQAQKPPAWLGALVLTTDMIVAATLWIFRDDIFGPGQDMIAGLIAGLLIFSGFVAMAIMRNHSRETR